MPGCTDGLTANPLVAQTILTARSYGNLDSIADSERRTLRSIGLPAREVAARTGALLADLLTLPGVRIFQGVRPAPADAPRIPHVVVSGHRLVFVESVAWPPGRYAATVSGRIHCDGVYIGQSVRALAAAVRHWQEVLPPGHQVSALVVVHPVSAGDFALPAAAPVLGWACAGDAVWTLRARLSRTGPAVSTRALATLIAATAAEGRD